MKLDQLIDIAMGNIFGNSLNDLERRVLYPGPFQFANYAQLIKKQL